MPELPEVEVLRRSLAPRLLGRRVAWVETGGKPLREPIARARLRRELVGRAVVAVRRRAKYLWVDFEGGRTLVLHLGMSGRLTVVPATTPREPHEHLSLLLDGGLRLRLRDPRRFGLAFVAATDALTFDPHLAGLGREPLDPPLDGAALAGLSRGRRGPLKAFLLDGRLVAGVGNIYACEALFRARLHPARSVATLRAEHWRRLAEAVVAVLERAIAAGGTTLNDFADADGREGLFQVDMAVYGRAGEPCTTCGARIRRLVQAGRSSYLCGRCQR